MTSTTLRIPVRFALTITALVLLTALAIGTSAQLNLAAELESAAKSKLSALRESRKTALEQYLESLRVDLRLLASNDMMRDALGDLTSAWSALGPDAGGTLRRLFISENPNVPGERDALTDPGDGSRYSERHAHFHPWFRQFLAERGYYDLFLFAPNGDLVYTAVKEIDLGTNFRNGLYAASNLGDAFQTIDANPTPRLEVFRDFELYGPSAGAPAGFIATPVYDRAGSYIGVLALQMPIDRINQVVGESAGLRATEHSYIVGDDLRMRTDIASDSGSTVLSRAVDTEAVRRALAGETGVSLSAGRLGSQVVSAYGPLSFMGVRWAILAETAYEDLARPIREATRLMLLQVGAVLFVALLIAAFVARGLSRPIVEMTESMRRLADGDLDAEIPATSRGDEIGEMAMAMAVFKDNARQRYDAEAALEDKQEQLQTALDHMPGGMFVVDAEHRLVLMSEGHRTILDLPDDITREGDRIGPVARFQAARGDYGAGNPETLAEETVKRITSGARSRYEHELASGRILEVRVAPAPDGGTVVVSDDITERRRAEREVQKTSAQLRAVLDQIPAGVYLANRDLEIEVVNDQLPELFGFPEGFVREGIHVAEMIGWLAEHGNYPGEDVESAVAKRIAALQSGELTVSEQTPPTGRLVQLTHRATPDGGVCAVITDITERRRVEMELQQSRDMFQALADHLPEFITMKNTEGRFLFVNKQFEEWTAKSRGDVVGKTVFDIYDDEQAQSFHELDRKVMSSGEPRSDEIPLAFPDGQTRTVLRTRFPVWGARGDMLGMGTVNRDVSDRKRAEEAIAAQKRVLEVVFENVNQGIAMFDAHARIVAWNRHYQTILGFDARLLEAGRPLAALARDLAERGQYGEGDFDAIVEKRVAYLTNGEVTRSELQIEERIYDVHKRPLADGGFVITYTDITERKRAEIETGEARAAAEQALVGLKAAQRNLVQSEKMASLGQLTAGIAHEIKNPLNFVNNFSETSVELLDEIDEVLAPVQEALGADTREELDDIINTLKGDLQTIHRHGKRADGIVKSMLLHARGDTSDPVPTAVNELVEEALKLAYHGERARDKLFNVTIEQDLDAAAGEASLVPQEITRVLVNLFSNAFYAMKQRGDEAPRDGYSPILVVKTRDVDGEVELRIRDNGAGMPAEIREKIFDPFYTTKPTGEGTGLGLSMSFDIIVHQHQGRLEVQSKPDEFTEFVIRLPRHSEAGLFADRSDR